MRRDSPVTRGLSGLLAADLISTIGTEMTAVALPWLVLVSTGSAARMGAVLAAEFLGIALLGLWGGRAATVLGARRMMLVSDLARACLVAAVPVLALLGALPLAVIVTIAFLVGGFFPAYSSSQRLVLAQLAGDDELSLTRAGGLLNSVNETASFVGPALGGVLVVVIGAGGYSHSTPPRTCARSCSWPFSCRPHPRHRIRPIATAASSKDCVISSVSVRSGAR